MTKFQPVKIVMVEIQLLRRFGHWALSKQKFEARSSASEMFSVLCSRSIRCFQARSAADLILFFIEPLI
jgi:hypothetical protein